MPTPLIIDHREGSGDFDEGPGGGTGKLLYYVVGAQTQDEAIAAALDHPDSLPVINGYLQNKASVAFQGGELYFVDLDYQRGVAEKAAETAGQTPEGSRPGGEGGKGNDEPLTRDMSFSTGGATRKRYTTLETRHKKSKNNGPA